MACSADSCASMPPLRHHPFTGIVEGITGKDFTIAVDDHDADIRSEILSRWLHWLHFLTGNESW